MKKERGILMFVVTIVIAVLTIGALSLLGLMKVERQTTLERLTEIQVASATLSGVSLIQTVAAWTETERLRVGGIYQNPALFRGVRVLSATEGSSSDICFTIIAPLFYRDDIEGIRYGLVNESSRLSLAALLRWEEESPGSGRAALMKLPGMTQPIADSLLDWIDPDDTPRASGAEIDYYQRARLPYSPRNELPVFLDEILLSRDMTRYQLYGNDEVHNFNNAASRHSTGGESRLIGSLKTPPIATQSHRVLGRDSQDPFPWSLLLTTLSAEKDADPKGEPRIDLNQSDLRFLYDELKLHTTEEAAAFVVLYRQFGPSTGGAASSLRASEKEIDFSRPAQYLLETPLDLVGTQVAVPNSEGKTYASPFPDNRQSLSGLFEFLDYASTSPSTVISGRINLLEAPRLVLNTIPDLPEAAVGEILSSRPIPGEKKDPLFRHAAWIYANGIVDLATMKKLWNKVTCGGDVWSAQIVGYLEGEAFTRRAEVVVDATVSPPRQVFYKDLSMYGPGFPLSVIQREPGHQGYSQTGLLSPMETNGSFFGTNDLP